MATAKTPQRIDLKEAHSYEYLKKIKGNKNVVFYYAGKEIKLNDK